MFQVMKPIEGIAKIMRASRSRPRCSLETVMRQAAASREWIRKHESGSGRGGMGSSEAKKTSEESKLSR
jgi:hypothetical protein